MYSKVYFSQGLEIQPGGQIEVKNGQIKRNVIDSAKAITPPKLFGIGRRNNIGYKKNITRGGYKQQ